MTRFNKLRFLCVLGLTWLICGFATPAIAADPIVCNGTIEHKAIVGDLVVPDAGSCTLRKVSISGNVTVNWNGLVETDSVTVGGTLVLKNSFARTVSTTVRGDVLMDTAVNVQLRYTTLVGSVVGTVSGLWMDWVQVNGRVGVVRPESFADTGGVAVRESIIGQGLRVDGLGIYAQDSYVGKYLVVDQATLRPAPQLPTAAICSTHVLGDLTMKWVYSPRIGVTSPSNNCAGPVTVDGSLLLLGSKGARAEINGTFGGQLVCRDNNLLPKAGPDYLTATGYIQQCAGLRPV